MKLKIIAPTGLQYRRLYYNDGHRVRIANCSDLERNEWFPPFVLTIDVLFLTLQLKQGPPFDVALEA